jgi:hypothetical protein
MTEFDLHSYGNKQKKMILFMGDEIQNLCIHLPEVCYLPLKYDPQSNLYFTEPSVQQKIVCEFLSIAKSPDHFVILSGNGRNVIDLCFKPEQCGFIGYHNLNNTVFYQMDMMPIRARDLFISCLKSLKKDVETYENGNYNMLFYVTGGVVRDLLYVASVPTSSNPSLSKFSDPALLEIMQEMLLKIFEPLLKRIRSFHPSFPSIASLIDFQTVLSFDMWKNCHGLPLSRVLKIISVLYPLNSQEMLSQYCDNGIFLELSNWTVEMLYPKDLLSLFYNYSCEKQNILEKFNFSGFRLK